MRNPCIPTLLVSLLFWGTTAAAAPDSFGLGTGRDGALTVTAPRTVINRYSQVTEPLAPGDTTLIVSAAEGFSAGDLVMVLQTTGIVPEPARGSPGPISLSQDPVGRWELARVAFASGQELKLEAPLIHSYAGRVTQVIRVPEYTDVKVAAGASLVAAPWDGSQGGLLAFLANGLIQNEGALDASGAGFRGGLVPEEAKGFFGCSSLPASVRSGAGRGEGISSLDFGVWATGLENGSNGGGGGLCPRAGGGGGGNGAAGGRGGDSGTYGDSSRDIGGLGGAGLVYSLLDHLTLGGGGGQGYGGGRHSQGGAGGGAIFVRGHRLAGSGTLQADGVAGEAASHGGAGGGGAGGSISLRIGDSAECGLISARGGNGGSSAVESGEYAGPGGGGGGGQVLYQAAKTGACPLTVEAGLAGELRGLSVVLGAGAQPTASQLAAHRGIITRFETAFERTVACTISAPTFTSPQNGQSVSAQPTFEGKIGADYGGGDTLKIGIDQAPAVEIPINLATRTWVYRYTNGTLTNGVTYQILATGYCASGGSAQTSILVTVDTTPPVLLLTPPSNPSYGDTATFSFRATNESRPLKFKCSLNGGGLVDCGTGGHNAPLSYNVTGLLEGRNTFTVSAVDEAGNPSTVYSYEWQVVLPLETTLLGTPPPNPSNSPNAEFTFQSSNPQATFKCRLDGVTWNVCTSPQPYTGLPDGNRTFEVKSIIGSFEDSTPASYTWRIDTVAPETTVTGYPPNPSNNSTPTFTFSASEGGSSFECRVDTAAFVSCTSSWTSPFLADGSHTFEVRAKDAARNQDASPASYTWTIDTVKPDTNLTDQPSNPSNDPTPTFSFISTEDGSTFDCKMDSGAFAPCASPLTSPPLIDGSHTFQVKAKDRAGNEDPFPASYTWVLDTSAPNTELIGYPPNPSNDPTPTFTFTSNKPGSTFECRIDTAAFAPCGSPWTTPTLPDGSHTVQVRAKDALGNVDPSPVIYTWVIDTVAPNTTLTIYPPNPSNDSTPTFEFTSTEAGSSFQCRLDSAPFSSCPSPVTFPPQPDGSHTFEVKAKDAAGNEDATAASYTWVIDTAPPDTNLTVRPPNPSNNPTPTFEFSSSKTGSTFECRMDSAPFAPCTSPWSSPVLGEGSHTFQVKATDSLGNSDPSPASYTWTVNLTPPGTVIDPSSMPRNPTNVTTATFKFSGAGPNGQYRCKLDSQDTAYYECNTGESRRYIDLSEVVHTFYVYSIDAAGNKNETNPASYSWKVDVTRPDTVIAESSKPSDPSNARTVTFVFSGTETDVKYFCSLDSAVYESCDSGEKTYAELNLPEGPHTFSVYAQDAAGNNDATPATYSWRVDRRGPDIEITNPWTNPVAKTWRTNLTSPTFIGTTSEAPKKVWISVDNSSPEETTGITGTNWTLTTSKVLAEGDHIVRAQASDAADNTGSPSATITFTVDTTPPDTQIESGPPAIHNSRIVPFSFKAPGEPLAFVTTFECHIVAHRYSKETDVGCSKQQAFNLAEMFEISDVNGDYRLCVAAKDEAGNLDPTRACQDWTVVVDPPGPPEIMEPTDGMAVYDLTPTISGKTISRGTVEFFLGGTKAGLAQADVQGTFTFKFAEPLPEGTYVLTAVVTDVAGNPSVASGAINFSVFAPKPVAEAIGGGLGCAASTAEPWIALVGLFAGGVWRSRRRRR